MLKIGDFSKLSMISVRMLRHYDENGLLVPVEVDRFSGYRYYSEEQLGLAMRITALRDIGFGVSAIREIIERSDDTHYIETMYIARREELYREYSRAAAKLSAVTSALESLNAGNHLREENNMNYTVTEKTFPESYAATVRMTIPSYEHEGMIWSVLVSETAGMNIVPADRRRYRSAQDGDWSLSGHRAREVQENPRGDLCHRGAQGLLREDRRGERRGREVGAREWIFLRGEYVQHISREPARNLTP